MAPREFHRSIDSTQRRAIERARSDAPAGTLVVAREQRRGVGRSEHVWESPPGGLYLSLVLAAPIARGALATLAVGVGLRELFHRRYGIAGVLKWPNDLLVPVPLRAPRKLAGILADEVPSESLGRALVVGLGVNVVLAPRALSAPVADRAISLGELVPDPPSLDELEREAVEAITGAIEPLDQPDGGRRLLEAARPLLYGIGRRARVDGEPVGIIEGLGADGSLLVDAGGSPRAIHTGDLVVEEP